MSQITKRIGRFCLVTSSAVVLVVHSAVAQSNAPTLKIVGSNDIVTVSWPLSAYYYVLEATTNLASPVPWNGFLTAAKVASFYAVPHAGIAQIVTNIIGDEITADLPVTNAQQFFRLEGPVLIPVSRFAIFYNALLEFSTSHPFYVNGPVHANGPIYTGSSSPLTFNETVTTASAISSPTNNSSGPWEFPGNVAFTGNPGYITNVPALTLPIGTNNPHAIIDIPPSTESVTSVLGHQRSYNQAHIVLLVSNLSVTAVIQASPGLGQLPASDPAKTMLRTSWANGSSPASIQASLRTNGFNSFLTLTNIFRDQREDKDIMVTQINVGQYAMWIRTNASVLGKFPPASFTYPLILYVADNRTNSATQLSAIRLINGSAPPQNGGYGWSVATRNPLYVWGNYNCTNSAHLASTNTTSTVPSALMADALTILSSSWQDALSFIASSAGPAASANNTVNAAIIAGIKPSTGAGSFQFSGGVHNLPRLLENWSGSTLWLNTSIINLYSSAAATGQFVRPGPGSYYVPPTREFSFDPKFANPSYAPPGTPTIGLSPPAN